MPLQHLAAVDYRCERCHEPAQRAYKVADKQDHSRLARATKRLKETAPFAAELVEALTAELNKT
jgi:hypothetical protein